MKKNTNALPVRFAGFANEKEPYELPAFRRQAGTDRFVEAIVSHTADTPAFNVSDIVDEG